MSSRSLLIAFGVVIAAGVIALLVAARSDSAAPTISAVTPSKSDEPEPRERPQISRTRPQVAAETDDPEPPTEYMTDGGVLVRDHRADRSKPAPINIPPRAPNGKRRKMKPNSVLSVRKALRPVVRKCEEEQPVGDLGPDPRLEAVVTVSVHSGKLTVDGISAHTKDVANHGIAGCVEDAFRGVELDVPGQPDIDHFPQTHPFRLGHR